MGPRIHNKRAEQNLRGKKRKKYKEKLKPRRERMHRVTLHTDELTKCFYLYLCN